MPFDGELEAKLALDLTLLPIAWDAWVLANKERRGVTSPSSKAHMLEALKRSEKELVGSVRRSPSLLSVWMINRILNTDVPIDWRQSYISLLNEAANRTDVPKPVREDARDFVGDERATRFGREV